MDSDAKTNTNRELWREVPGDYYAPSIHVTATGCIGINVGGTVIVMAVHDWHALANCRKAAPADAITTDSEMTAAMKWLTADNSPDRVCMEPNCHKPQCQRGRHVRVLLARFRQLEAEVDDMNTKFDGATKAEIDLTCQRDALQKKGG